MEMCTLLPTATGDTGSNENPNASQPCAINNTSNASAVEDAAFGSNSLRGAVVVIVCSVVGVAVALCIGATVCVGLVTTIGCGNQNLNRRQNQGKQLRLLDLAW